MKGIFLKIAEAKHINDMYSNEYLFFNTFSSFRAKEKDASGRQDPREANTINRQATYLEVNIPGKGTIKLSEIMTNFNAQFNEHPAEIPFNICSLYTIGINEDDSFKQIDERVLKLGDRAILIFNLKRFFEILDEQLETKGIGFSRKPVTYYGYKTFDGDLSFHHKEDSFNYQNEYRILLKTEGDAVIKIQLPGLKEISEIAELKSNE